MSQWTHINASIRYDSFLGHGVILEKELGKMCKWEDEDTSHWDNPDIPCGSEGSIEYTVIKTGTENSLAAQVVCFYGDLRDYKNVEEILKYFERITTDKMIRSGILEIDVEWNKTLIYKYNIDETKWKLLNTIPNE